MSSTFQTVAALAIVVLTLGLFAWRSIARRKNPGCGGGCGCPGSEIKRQLKAK